MSQRSSYDAGTPCWVDLVTPDVDAAKEFYTGLFGWTADDSVDEESGHRIYTNLRRDGQLVAGMAGQSSEMAGMPPTWSTYICTEDAAKAAEAVEAAGGTVLMPAMQVMEQGSMAFFADPSGAAFGVWQPGLHKGAEVVNEPRAYAWNELNSRDLEAARPFYAQVFGWEYDDGMDMGEMGRYYVVQGGDEGGLAGMMSMPPMAPAEVPSHWAVYFAVEDAQAVIDRAQQLGGSLVHGPDPSPVGVLAGLTDPQGGHFKIIELQAQQPQPAA
jgi:uncharacterized protein